MNCDNWYISLDYNYADVEKTMKILEVLDYKKHKVLCGRSLFYDYCQQFTEEELEEYINNLFAAYLLNNVDIKNITNINAFEKIMRGIFLKKYGINKENVDFIFGEKNSIKKLLDKFTDIDERTLWELKCTFTEHINASNFAKTYTDNYKMYTADKIRFTGIEDQSFSSFFETYKPKKQKCMYTWYEINDEQDLKRIVLTTDLDLIITDDINDISDFIYYINIIERNNFAITINDNQNKLGELETDLLKICSEEQQFTKFRSTLIPFI